MASPPNTPPLSVALRALIEERNILTRRTKSKVLNVLDEHIITRNNEFKQEKLRIKTIEEIFTSEESYLRNLEIAMKYFKAPFDEGEMVLPSPLKTLFDHLESIYNVNGELLNHLRLYGENVGASFQKVAPFFKLYSVYAFDYKEGIKALEDLGKTHQKLNLFIKRQETRPEVCSKLSSLLISPIQRVPRYRLLLRELLNHTPSDHLHYKSIVDALKEVENATEHINTLVSEQENMKRMVELQKYLIGGKPLLIQPGRKLIKEGILMKVSKKSDKSKSRYFILTSDVLMYCKMFGVKLTSNCLKCCCVIPLRKMTVSQVLNDRLFNVNSNGLSLMLYSAEPYASELWVNAIRKAIQEENECQQTLKRRGSARLALLRKDLNQISDSFTPRKRKPQPIQDLDGALHPFHSPWKRNRLKSESDKGKNSTAGSSGINRNRLGYFASFRRAFSSLSDSLHKYWMPSLTGKENDSKLT